MVALPQVETELAMDFTSGYVLRGIDKVPAQGTEAPWKLEQSYFYDLIQLSWGSLGSKTMEFAKL